MSDHAPQSAPDLYAVAGALECTVQPSTPLKIPPDFCLVPIGTAEPSVAAYVAECHRVLEKTGLKFKVSLSHLSSQMLCLTCVSDAVS